MAYAGQTPGTDQTLADQPLEDRADMLDKTHHRIRRLIKDGILPPSRLCRALPTRSVPTICNRNGWLPRLSEQVIRVAACGKPASNVSRHLRKRGTMNGALQRSAERLDGIVVERQTTIVEAAHQRCPARPHIAEGSGEFGFAGELAHRVVGPSGQCLGN